MRQKGRARGKRFGGILVSDLGHETHQNAIRATAREYNTKIDPPRYEKKVTR